MTKLPAPGQNAKYLVYVLEIYWDAAASSDDVHCHWTVLAHTPREALRKCLQKIRDEIKTARLDIKFVSVNVGHKHYASSTASRMTPLRLTRDGREVLSASEKVYYSRTA